MKIIVTAKPSGKRPTIQKISKTEFVVAVKEPLVEDRANRAIVQALSEYFNVGRHGLSWSPGFHRDVKLLRSNPSGLEPLVGI